MPFVWIVLLPTIVSPQGNSTAPVSIMSILRRGRIFRHRIQYGDGARHETPAQANPAQPAALDADLRAGRAGGGSGGAVFPYAALRAFGTRHRAAGRPAQPRDRSGCRQD